MDLVVEQRYLIGKIILPGLDYTKVGPEAVEINIGSDFLEIDKFHKFLHIRFCHKELNVEETFHNAL